MSHIRSFLREDEGQGLAEYALIVGGVALAVLAAVYIFGNSLTGLFTDAATTIEATPGEGTP